MRSLNETVNFSPVECRYKFYIIDEAHMLSTGAFNALLKTLEEPPEKTIFILATTEPHKIPITIHSRCQHLHFRNLTTKEITLQLQHVAKSESLNVNEKGLNLIARNSSGCMRDALSLLNQVYSFKGSTISYKDILFVLGTTEDTTLFQLLDQILSNNHKGTVQILQSLTAEGANSTQLLNDIMRLTTQLLHMTLGLVDIIDGTSDHHNLLKALSSKTSIKILTQLNSTLANIEGEMRWFSYPSLLLEIRLTEFINTYISKSKTITNSSQIQSQLSPKQDLQQISHSTASQHITETQSISPESQANDILTSNKNTFQTLSIPSEPPANDIVLPNENMPETSSIPPEPQANDILPPKKNMPETSSTLSESQVSVDSITRQSNLSTDKVWSTILGDIKKQSSALYALLQGSVVVQEDETIIYVKLKQSFKFFIDKLKETHHQEFINKQLAIHFNPAKKFRLYDGNPLPNITENNATADTIEQPNTHTEKKIDNSDNKLINDVVKLFEGTVV